jgi:glycosyltransferase involved in cell wall biosynthesis
LTRRIDFDVVQIEDSCMAIYLESVSYRDEMGTLLSFNDIISKKYARMSKLESKLTRRLRQAVYSHTMRSWEPRVGEQFDCCLAVSEDERRELIGANPKLSVEVVPNGVDTVEHQLLPDEANSPAVIFVGNMDYRPNVDAVTFFCRDILPRIRSSFPDLEMWIVGLNPRDEVKQLEGRGVHVTGRVDDVQPYYQRSTVCVVPLRAGGGTRLKILESMALGRPVVSTTVGCEGLDITDGEHLFVADSPELFAEKTIRLLKEDRLRYGMSERARQLVERRYDWGAIANRLLDIYTSVAKDRKVG